MLHTGASLHPPGGYRFIRSIYARDSCPSTEEERPIRATACIEKIIIAEATVTMGTPIAMTAKFARRTTNTARKTSGPRVDGYQQECGHYHDE